MSGPCFRPTWNLNVRLGVVDVLLQQSSTNADKWDPLNGAQLRVHLAHSHTHAHIWLFYYWEMTSHSSAGWTRFFW